MTLKDPRTAGARPPFPQQQQPAPGATPKLDPPADHGEESYRGAERLKDTVALITGGDSGIGRAVAIAFAREGADVVIAYLQEHEDAEETARWFAKRAERPSSSRATWRTRSTAASWSSAPYPSWVASTSW